MYTIPTTTKGALIRMSESDPVLRNFPRYANTLHSGIEYRNLFRFEINIPEDPSDLTNVSDDYGFNIIEYQEYEVPVKTFYCNSVAWDGDDATRDETGEGTKELPWRNVNYALEQLIPSLKCAERSCVYIQLLIRGTINYSIGYPSGSVFYDGLCRLILDVWKKEESDPDKWEVANADVNFAGIYSLAGTYIYNCHVHDLNFVGQGETGFGIYINPNPYSNPSVICGCKVSNIHTHGNKDSCGIQLTTSDSIRGFTLMAYNCHVENVTSEYRATGFRLYARRATEPTNAFISDCSASNIHGNQYRNYAYQLDACGFDLSAMDNRADFYVQRCNVYDVSSYYGDTSGFYSQYGSCKRYFSDCHVEKLQGRRIYGILGSGNCYGCTVYDLTSDITNSSGINQIEGIISGGIDTRIFNCSVSEISSLDEALGMDIYGTAGMVCNCNISNMTGYQVKGLDLSGISIAYNCNVENLEASYYALGTSISSSKMYGSSVNNCYAVAGEYNVRAVSATGFSVSGTYLYSCTCKKIKANNDHFDEDELYHHVAYATGVASSISASYSGEIDGVVISDVEAKVDASGYDFASSVEAVAKGLRNSYDTNKIMNLSISGVSASARSGRDSDKGWYESFYKVDLEIGKTIEGCNGFSRSWDADEEEYEEIDLCE